MSLSEVFCQDKAISILHRAYAAGKVPHAYIFTGQEGVGKFMTASGWAKLLLCRCPVIEKDLADSCGACSSCRLFEAGSHPDFNHVYKELVEFTKEGKGKTAPVDLPIDVIREFLIEKAPAKPTLSAKKVFVVSEAEKLNKKSQNCLLKILEEPPGYCCIILLCTSLEKMLPTTKSRCRLIRFGPVDEQRIADKLESMGMERQQGQYFGRLAEGSIGAASQWAALELAQAGLYKTKKDIVNFLGSYKYGDSLDIAQHLVAEIKKIAAVWTKIEEGTSKTDISRRAQKFIIRIIISALHDAMKLDLTGPGRIINFDQQEEIKSISERFGVCRLTGKIADICKTLHWTDSSVNQRLIFEQLLLNLAASGTITV